ncbi:MAG: heme lyase NrfEFG subunit NrfE, partial [Beijerinckiaceae bacterium]
MIVEAGHYALVLALALAIIQSVTGLWAGQTRDAALAGMTRAAATGAFLFTALSFAALTYAYLVSDFSVRNVIENSHSAKPTIYKISGVWGNHEGSMLLWVLVLTVFAGFVAWRRGLPDVLRSNVLAVQGMVGIGFFLFIL